LHGPKPARIRIPDEQEVAVTYVLCCLAFFSAYQQTPPTSGARYTLTIQVENVNKESGNIGVLVFNFTMDGRKTQILGLVLMTKKLVEAGSEESK
jgi:hypothetical protein